MTTDWWEVDISGAIDSITEQQIIDNCFDSGGSSSVCAFLHRGTDGVLASVDAPFLNLSQSYAEGVDFEMAYSYEPNFFDSQNESLSLRLLAGKLLERFDVPPGGVAIDQVGSMTRPDWTANLTARYGVGPWSFTWQQRAISESEIVLAWEEGVDVDLNVVGLYSFTNLSFRYDGGEMLGGADWNVSLSVNNAFNKNPPIVPGNGTGNGNYDEFGRRYQLTLNMNF
jgi:outer membrane receptor protein involved in Fe transport